MKTIFDLCDPRSDVVKGRIRDEEFAADLASVVTGTAVDEYAKPAIFFKHTHPTRGLRALLDAACRRLSGTGGELSSVVRLDTQFGGGKTHSLIALVHAARGMKGVAHPEEFVDPALLPTGEVRVAALDGENSDPANGLRLEGDLFARSLWGEMAYQLAGVDGFNRVRKSDETHVAPGATTIKELFGAKPTLILIDEVAVYLRKVARVFPDSTDQFTAFIHALYKAVASTPNVALVTTLAVRSDSKAAQDAYRAEQGIAMAAFDEAESVLSRKATQLNPTEEDETVDVIRRRLFERIDDSAAESVVAEYCSLWDRNKESLPEEAFGADTREQFSRGYPFHPETLNTLIEKTSSLSTFQRTRGMLRLLARTVQTLWAKQPDEAFAIHPHHIDPSVETIRGEITTRLGQGAYTPALATDVASVPGKQAAIAEQLDQANYPGQAPVTSYLARTVFLHTLAYGDAAQGILPDWLNYSVCSPTVEPSFVKAARRAFVAESLYLDDRPEAPLRFLTEPNLTQMIRKAAAEIDPGEVRENLNEKIRDLFAGKGHNFEPIFFPGGPYEVPDDIGDGRPYLVILGHDAFSVADEPSSLPTEIIRLATRKGASEELRSYRNNLVFAVADERLCDDMKQSVRRRLALAVLKRPERMRDLADHQQREVNEQFEKTSFRIAVAIMQCYRHLFYPSHITLGGGNAQIGHTVIEVANASDTPGNGQIHIKRTLRDQKKLLDAGDSPDAPTFVRDQTPLKTKGHLTTQELRSEFRRAPKLSILLDDDPLIRCIREGIQSDAFIYRKGDLVWGKGDPSPEIEISENAFVHTIANAKELNLWPRSEPKPEPEPKPGEPRPTEPKPGEPQPRTPEPGRNAVTAQGPLRQALTELFEKARASNDVAEVRIRLFAAKETWALHQAVATHRGAKTICHLNLVDLESEGVESFSMRFAGSIDKANAVKSFLQPQIQAGRDHEFNSEYRICFNAPLPTQGEKPEGFIKAMTKYGGGEAFVEAQAGAKEGD